jgi:hypothetical protein
MSGIQRSLSRLRKGFSELSFEKKLTIFFVPVFVALLGTFVPRFLGGDGGGGGGEVSVVIDERDEPRAENLEVVELVARNSQDPWTSAEIRVLVRNTGTVDSLIHSAEFRVAEYDALELCFPPEGELEVSGTYELVLPALQGDGRSFDVDLQQRIPAGEPDVFSFEARLGDEYAPVNGDSRLYALDVFLHHDTAEAPLAAGRVLLALPFPGTTQVVNPGEGSLAGAYFDPECPSRNVALLQSFLAGEGERSGELDQAAADPSAFYGAPSDPLPEPTEAERESALAAGTEVASALGARDLEGACEALDPGSRPRLELESGLECPELVRPLADLVAAGFAGPPEVMGEHAGWIRMTAPASGDGHQLVLVAQASLDPFSPERVVLGWVVTNLYDAAEGPLDLANR